MTPQYPSSLSVDRFTSTSDRRHSSSSSTRHQRPEINQRPIVLWTHDPPNLSRNEVVLNPEFSLPRMAEADLLQLTLPQGSRLPRNNIPFGPKDRIRSLATKATFVFRAAQATADADLIARQPQLQISVSKNIANNYGFYNRAQAILTRVSKEDYTIDHVELYFRDQYVGRAEMWRVFQNLEDTCVYCGQKVTLAGSVRATIGRIFIKQSKVTSGYVSPSTKAIFRSESAKYNLFIQLAREMWEFDEDGEIYYEKALQGFIPELLRRWRAVPTNHILTVILFARVHYDQSELHMLQGPIRQDCRARYYIDYYKVVVDLESNCNWDAVMTTLKEEFFRFQHDILLLRRPISGPAASHEELHADLIRDRVHMAGRLSYSYEGNLLEAINLALNPFDQHYIDRDLNRTGLSMVFVTAGTGHFDVDKKLLRVTTERMIENGTGLDLVCLTKMPLHSVPLFHFKSHYPDPSELKQSQTAANNRQRRAGAGAGPGMTVHRPGQPPLLSRHSSSRMATLAASVANLPDPLYFDSKKPVEEEQDFYSMPHWVDCSFYNLQQDKPFRADRFVPRCKMYEVQMMGIMENQISDIAIPYLDLKPVNKTSSVSSWYYLPRYMGPSSSGFMSEPRNSEVSDLALAGLSPKQQRRIASERFDHDVFRDVPPLIKAPALKQLAGAVSGTTTVDSPAASEIHKPFDRPGLRRNPSSGYGTGPHTNANSAASSISPGKAGASRPAAPTTRASRLGRETSFREEEPDKNSSVPPSPSKARFTKLEPTTSRPPLTRPVSQIVTSSSSNIRSRPGSIRSVNTFARGLMPLEPIGKAKALVAPTDAVLSATSHAFEDNTFEEDGAKRNEADDSVSTLSPTTQAKAKGYSWLWKTLTGSTPPKAHSTDRETEDDAYSGDLSTPATRSMQEVLSAQLRQQAGVSGKSGSPARKPQPPGRLVRTASLLSVHEASSPAPIKIPAQSTPRTRQEQEAEEKVIRDQEAYEQQLEEEEALQRYAQRAQVDKQTLVNPSNPSKNLRNDGSQLLRWQHLFPRRLNHHAVKWRSMTTPACLPLTTLYFPSESDLVAMWSEHPHTTSISAETSSFLLKKSSSTHPALAVLREMAYHRLAQGYQFIVPASKQARTVSSRKLVDPKHFTLRWPSELLQPGNLATGNPIFLSVTNQIHRISYDRSTSAINVKRYVRNTEYSTDPIDYDCCIWPRHLPGYQTVKARFNYPDSASYNWTYLDSLIAGYVDEKFVESLRYWRTRFVLVPSEGSPPPMKAATGEVLDDEEIRLIGTDKLAELFHRARFVRSKEERDQTHVQRFLPTSLDPAMSLQDEDFMKQLAEENARQRAQSTSSKKRLHKSLAGRALEAVVKDMRSGGLVINDRIWHRMLYSDTFTGADMVTWMCTEYTDVRSREEAVDWGIRLMEDGLFEHVHKAHGFLDGHYFYRLRSEYAGSRGVKGGWFRGTDSRRESFAEKETPKRPLVHSSSQHSGLSSGEGRRSASGEVGTEKGAPSTSTAAPSSRSSTGGHSRNSSIHHPHPPSLTMSSTTTPSMAPTKKKKIQLSRTLIIDVDPGRRSDRAEVAFLHHDMAHNPANGFNFQIHWLSTTARFIEDTVQSWTRILERYGLRLIEAPIGQIKDVSLHNPFQAPVQIEVALPPPAPEMYERRLPRGTLADLWFEYALLRKFGFVLDQEATSRYGGVAIQVGYSSRPNQFEFSQFVHRSGVAFVQVLGGVDGFLWLNNRLFNSHFHGGSQRQQHSRPTERGSAAPTQGGEKGEVVDGDKLRLELTRFCSNCEELARFYRKVLAQLLQVEKEESEREELAKEYVQSLFQGAGAEGAGGMAEREKGKGKSREGSHHSN